MSLLGAMNTAITGLNAQSAAFSNIGDNIANSQTTGFKAVNTSFEDYLTTSTAATNMSGSVVATPAYQNNVQGTVVQSSDTLGLAITGQGFFPVSQSTGSANGSPVFSPIPEYTRAGDFQLDKNGYVVNGAGQYLNAWAVDPKTGVVNRTQLNPVQIAQSTYSPVPTSTVMLAANLPSTPGTTSLPPTQIPVYDRLGNQQQLNLQWTQSTTTPGQWTVALSSPNATAPLGTATVNFATTGASAGTIQSITDTSGTTSSTAGQPAQLNISATFPGSGAQSIALNLGTFGQANGLTQYAGTDISIRTLTQDGVPAGSFTGLTTNTNGDLIANYSNGQNQTLARVPVVTFADPNALQRQNGQGFTQTTSSGSALAQDANSNGAGALVTNSVESSNVDIAQEFSKLIVAQRAYSANTKMVTTADQMLQDTLNMKQ